MTGFHLKCLISCPLEVDFESLAFGKDLYRMAEISRYNKEMELL